MPSFSMAASLGVIWSYRDAGYVTGGYSFACQMLNYGEEERHLHLTNNTGGLSCRCSQLFPFHRRFQPLLSARSTTQIRLPPFPSHGTTLVENLVHLGRDVCVRVRVRNDRFRSESSARCCSRSCLARSFLMQCGAPHNRRAIRPNKEPRGTRQVGNH